MMKRIICFGDSNTFGYNPQDLYGEPYKNPWPSVLGGIIDAEVLNWGVNGAETPDSDFRRKLKLDRLAKNSPFDLVIVMYSTNDILNAVYPDVRKIEENLEMLVLDIKEAFQGVVIVLVVPPVLRVSEDNQVIASKKMRKIIRGIAEKDCVIFADVNACELEMTYDGIHFSERDHQKIAVYLADVLKTNAPGNEEV